MRPVRRLARGLTLLEMIVVLLIASMALALGFQSLGQWRRAEGSITQMGGALRAAGLTASWWRESIRGLLPVKALPFSGARQEVSGITLAPVLESPGASMPVTWTLQPGSDGNIALLLREGEKTLALPLPDATEAHFMFIDKDGKPHAQWPPALGMQEDLPSTVALVQTLAGGRQRVWAASVSGSLKPLALPFELEQD